MFSTHPFRVCVTGVECSGKTTLCEALSTRYDTPIVPEAGREYFAEKLGRGDATVFTGDLLSVLREQARREDVSSASGRDVAIWDTDVMTVAMWHDMFTGDPMGEILDFAEDRRAAGLGPDLYLLCTPDFRFVPDSVRLGGPHRLDRHVIYQRMLAATDVPVFEVGGAPDARFREAVRAIDAAVFAANCTA